MSVVLIILISFGIVLLLFGYFAFLAFIYYRYFKRKGYVQPLIVALFPATIVLSFFAGLLALGQSRHQDESLYVTLYLLTPVVLSTAVIYAAGRLLPPKIRNAKTRKIRFPYATLGYSLIAIGILQFLVLGFEGGWKTERLNLCGKLFNLSLLLAFSCLYMAKRAQARSAAEVLETDSRPPVLYLRAFNTEELHFVCLPNNEASKYSSYLGTKTGVTLEQYFAPALQQMIGPLVALGNPEDYAPPEGAARVYERDENWKEQFLNFARNAACIIIQVGASNNLHWEFETLRHEGLQEKTFVLTRPKVNLGAWNRFYLGLGGKVQSWMQRLKGAKPSSWQEFSEEIREAGFSMDFNEPPPGSIFAFDSRGAAIPLGANAQEPEDYIAVMLERLQTIAAGAHRGFTSSAPQ